MTKKAQGGTGYYSRFYHDEFAGYAERTVVAPNGKKYIERYYAAEYYRQKLPRKQQIQLRLIYAGLFIFSATLYSLAGWPDTASNYAVYVSLPVALALPFLVWQLLSFFYYMPLADMKLVNRQKGVGWLKKSSLGASVCIALAALGTLIYFFLNPGVSDSRILPGAIMFFLAALAALCINRLEARVGYQRIDNPAELSEEDSVLH